MSQKWCWDIHATRIQSSKNVRDLWQPERRQQRVHHWSSSFIVDQTRALACISLSFLHEYDVKLQISLFMEDVKTPEDDILFLFFFFFFFRKPWELYSRKMFVTQIKRDGMTEMKCETTRIAPLTDVFAAVAVVQAVNDVNFLRTTLLHNQEESIKWSLKAKCFNLLSNSLN